MVVPHEDKYGDLNTGENLVNTNLFVMEEEETTDAWIKELSAKHIPETEEYGISSIVFEATDAPFHPERLDAVIAGFGKGILGVNVHKPLTEGGPDVQPFQGVIRAKGQVWIANANAYPLNLLSWSIRGRWNHKACLFFTQFRKVTGSRCVTR